MPKFIKYFLFSAVVFALITPCLFAQESDAQKAYNQGDYLEAAKLYQTQVKQTEKPGAVLYYNLANSYYKLGLTPKALAAYYKAWRLNPRDKDIRHNLAYVMAQNGQNLVPTDIPQTAFNLFFYLSIIELEGLLWLLGWIFVIVLIFVLFTNSNKVKQLPAFLIVILIFTGSWYLVRRPIDTKPLAVIRSTSAEVRSGPGEKFPVNLSVPRSHIVEVKDTKADWAQIYIPAEQAQGWVLKDSLEEI
jgi:tetratricopeptide (TPR) repeat protein